MNNYSEAVKFSGLVRQKLANELKLINDNEFNFCWIVDFPMYQYDEVEKKSILATILSSMPQVDINEFDKLEP